MSPLVSILIPAFNSESWISDSIKSAVDQTWKPIEVIVVDDGSTDDTLRIARRFASNHVKVISQQNSGASAARNLALRLAQGDYIQWLDADDSLDPDKIAYQMNSPSKGDRVLLSSAWGQYYYRRHKAHFRTNPLCTDRSPADWLQTKMETNAWMAIESWLVPRTISDQAGPWDIGLSADDDGEYFARVVCSSQRIVYVSEARSRCRLANPNSLSKGPRTERWLRSQFDSIMKQIDYLLSLDASARSHGAAVTLLQRWYGHFYPDHPDLMRMANSLALRLGGELSPVQLRWKYRLLEPLLGAEYAKRCQELLPKLKARGACRFDQLLHFLGS